MEAEGRSAKSGKVIELKSSEKTKTNREKLKRAKELVTPKKKRLTVSLNERLFKISRLYLIGLAALVFVVNYHWLMLPLALLPLLLKLVVFIDETMLMLMLVLLLGDNVLAIMAYDEVIVEMMMIMMMVAAEVMMKRLLGEYFELLHLELPLLVLQEIELLYDIHLLLMQFDC